MKKQLKTTILAIGLLASVTGAFASDISNALTGKKPQVVDWIRLDRSGTEIPGSEKTGTEANPYPLDCLNGTTTVCAEGTVQGDSTPSLFYFYN